MTWMPSKLELHRKDWRLLLQHDPSAGMAMPSMLGKQFAHLGWYKIMDYFMPFVALKDSHETFLKTFRQTLFHPS